MVPSLEYLEGCAAESGYQIGPFGEGRATR
jgi:hypothetical protein